MTASPLSHVAIIMDGNGRWAKERGLKRTAGHYAGVKTVKMAVKASQEFGIRFLTLYTFSTENWERPQSEVSTLMQLLVDTVGEEEGELLANQVRVRFIGDRDRLNRHVRESFEQLEEQSKENTGLNLIIALSYSGRWEIVSACKEIAKKVYEGKLREENITEATFSKHLSTNSIPDPDLLIRTGGEYRISNFLLWQAAYSEFYFSPTYWPDFSKEEFHKAVNAFSQRERRYGDTDKRAK